MNDRHNGAATDATPDPTAPGSHDTPDAPDPSADPPAEPAAGTSSGRFGIRRSRTRAEERIAALDTSPARLAAEVDELRARAEAAEQELAETTAAWQRSVADYQNLKRRTEQDRQGLLAHVSERVLGKVLGIADDFDRAIAHAPDDPAMAAWVEGVTAIERKLRGLLESEGVTPIDAVGRPFDPHQHEAIAHEPTTDVPDGVVLREYQRGYELNGRVLRAALVAVADNGTAGTTTTDQMNDGADPAHDSED